jgi:polysaccharide biosynthesis transport protein
MDLIYLLRVLLRRKLILIGVPLLAALTAFLLTIDYKRTYKSTAQLSTGFTINEQVKIMNESFSMYEAEVKFNNLIETLTSPKVLGLLSYRLMLHDLEDNFPFRNLSEDERGLALLASFKLETLKRVFRDKLKDMQLLSSSSEDEKKYLELLKAYGYDYITLKSGLLVTRVENTDFISITFSSENAQLSAYVVNTLSEEFFRYNASLRSQRSVESVETFAKLLEQKKAQLDSKSDSLRIFKSTQGVLNFGVESENKLSQITKYEAQKEEERSKIRSLQFSIQDTEVRIRSAKGKSQGYLTENSNAEIIRLRKTINDMNQRYIAGGSKSQALLDSINILRRDLVAMSSSTNTESSEPTSSRILTEEELLNKKQELEVDLAIARQNLVSIDSTLSVLRFSVGSYASKEAKISSLEREVELASQEYLNAQEKYNQAVNLSMASGNNIRQVLEGQPAVEPEPSKRLIITAMAYVSALIFCILAIVFAEYVDVSIKTPSYLESQVDAKLLGVLHHIDMKKYDMEDIFVGAKRDKLKNAFRGFMRKIRYEVESSGKKIILLTSTKEGEGKTTIIRALAYSLSQSKKKVLLVDTNFHNNELTKLLDAKAELENLSENTEKSFKALIKPTTIPHVDALGCTGGDYTPAEVLSYEKFSTFIEEASQKYDFVLLEGAAVNIYADSRELARYVDGIIAIFSAKSSLNQTDRNSVQFLQRYPDKMMGLILNNVEAENVDQ